MSTAKELAKDMRLRSLLKPTQKRDRAGWGPCLSRDEAAAEFGIKPQALTDYIRHHDGPAPEMSFTGTTTKMGKTYYKASEIRAWWRKLQEKKGVAQ